MPNRLPDKRPLINLEFYMVEFGKVCKSANMKMKTYAMILGGLLCTELQANPDLAKRQCRSTHLWWSSVTPNKEKFEAFYIEMKLVQVA